MTKKFDYLIVGAGLFGCVVAEQLAADGNHICIIESRNHIGGNCYDENDSETGILYHKYGPHIFHATDESVISYIKNFTDFTSYFHQVLTTHKNKVYQMPINLETINSFFNINLRPYEVKDFLYSEAQKENIGTPTNMEEMAISIIGRSLYEAFFKEYTLKQWEKDPKTLPASIIQRLPVRYNYSESYYRKKFHGVPTDGFTPIFKKMLSNKNISIMLETDYFKACKQLPPHNHLVFTGPIDKFFNYKFGKLEYRTVSFEREVHPVQDWQGTSVMNYAEQSYPYTRICEPRHFYPEKWAQYPQNSTVIFKEFSSLDTTDNPFYPITDDRNKNLLKKYLDEAGQLKNITFGGRLGMYKYYDMEDAILAAFDCVAKLSSKVTT